MRSDPLDFFEKIADEKPAAPRPDDKLIDPGEEAVLGLAIASSFGAKYIPGVAQMILGNIATRGSAQWAAHSIEAQETVLDAVKAIRRAGPQRLPPPPEKSFMGLFPIRERFKIKDSNELKRAVALMEKMQPRVDLMLSKYDLPKKGVTISFKGGPLSSWAGPHYALTKKQIVLPSFSEATALHEVGHAVDYTAGRVGKTRAWVEPNLRRLALATLPIALVAGDEIKRAIPGTVDDRVIEFMQQNAAAIMGATLAATSLYPEGKASILALKHIKETRGPKEALRAARRLLPAWGTYALGLIAPMIGLSLATKYYNEAHKKRNEESIAKEASFGKQVQGLLKGLESVGDDFLHIGRQIARGTAELIKDPQRSQRIARAAKEVGTDPLFIEGALMVGIPAAAATAWVYSSRHGKHIRALREREDAAPPGTHIVGVDAMLQTGGRLQEKIKDQVPEEWRQENPGLYAGLVGAGAALSGGIITKLFSDLVHAL